MADEDLINKIEETTIDAKRYQQQTLATILHINGRVGYLRQFLKITNNHFTVDNFRQLVPLSTYDDYADHINRMAEGISDDDDHDHGRHFLSVDPLLCFFLSSGTSSMKPKLIPYFDSAASKAVSFLAHHGSSAIQRRLFPQRPTVNKSLWFIYAGNVTVTKSGFKAMPASSVPLSGGHISPARFYNCLLLLSFNGVLDLLQSSPICFRHHLDDKDDPKCVNHSEEKEGA